MPYLKFKITDAAENHLDVVRKLRRFLEHIYDIKNFTSEGSGDEIAIDMYVPGRLKRAEFEEDMNEFCSQNDCTFELVNQAPEAPSPQYFSENMKLMYPRIKKFEDFKKWPKKFEVAKSLWKKSWGDVPFDEINLDDQEDMVLLYNMYMEELSEWKPVWIKLKFKPEESEKIEEIEEINEIDFDEEEEEK